MNLARMLKIQEVLKKVDTEEVKAFASELDKLSLVEKLSDEQKTRLGEIEIALSKIEIPEAKDEKEDKDGKNADAASDDSEDNDDDSEDNAGDSKDDEDGDSTEDAKADKEDSDGKGEVDQLDELRQEVRQLQAEKTAQARIQEMKEKGLNIVFADKKTRDTEIKRLMKMSDAEYADHVTLLKAAVEAGVKKAEAAALAASKKDDETDETKPPVVSTASLEEVNTAYAMLDSLFDDEDEDKDTDN